MNSKRDQFVIPLLIDVLGTEFPNCLLLVHKIANMTEYNTTQNSPQSLMWLTKTKRLYSVNYFFTLCFLYLIFVRGPCNDYYTTIMIFLSFVTPKAFFVINRLSFLLIAGLIQQNQVNFKTYKSQTN